MSQRQPNASQASATPSIPQISDFERELTSACLAQKGDTLTLVKEDATGVHPPSAAANTVSTDVEKQIVYVEYAQQDGNVYALKKVRISGWTINTRTMTALVHAFSLTPSLTTLKLWNIALTEATFEILAHYVSSSTTLRILHLEGNAPQSKISPSLWSKLLLVNDDSDIVDDDETAIVKHKVGNALQQLHVRNNNLDDQCAQSIGDALKHNRSLIHLDLAHNHITSVGAKAIANGLRVNRSLFILSLSRNLIDDNGALLLAEVLGQYALTHEETVERRRLLIESKEEAAPDPLFKDGTAPTAGKHTSSGRKKEPLIQPNSRDTTMKKGSAKVAPTPAPTRDGKDKKEKAAPKSKSVAAASTEEMSSEVENHHAFIDGVILDQSHNWIVPGNKVLAYLDLSGNKCTKATTIGFLHVLTMQQSLPKKQGLFRLQLQDNEFQTNEESFIAIRELLKRKDPLQQSDDNTRLETPAVA